MAHQKPPPVNTSINNLCLSLCLSLPPALSPLADCCLYGCKIQLGCRGGGPACITACQGDISFAMNHGPEEDRAGEQNNPSPPIRPLLLRLLLFLVPLLCFSVPLHLLNTLSSFLRCINPSPSVFHVRSRGAPIKPPGLALVYCLQVHEEAVFTSAFIFSIFVSMCSPNLPVV